jgi:hypothetical protein
MEIREKLWKKINVGARESNVERKQDIKERVKCERKAKCKRECKV